ncbi:MAG: ATP-binding cassette domain-containing protein [Candidatus Nanoarchaeia archaeon]|nr:ATP-binding cassette domain-containing protein [Candidatus Nanoarchaeia archaeon]
MSEIIKVTGLVKHYRVKEKKGILKDLFSPEFKNISAVDNISFSIDKGEIVGFIGPNGAGKTTTIKMLTGILHPDFGEIISNGFVPYKQRKNYLKKVGVVFGQRKSMWPEISVMDNLELIGSFYNVSGIKLKDRIKELGKLIDISDFINQPFRKLSLGQQMKAELVSCLVYKPDILFLDEPTIGMDIIAKFNFIQLLKKINGDEKTTIILTSHDLSEIENLCKRLIIINHGKLVYDGDFSKIKPDEVIIKWEDKGEIKEKRMKKNKVAKFLEKIDIDTVTIKEIPVEEIIKEFYK